MTKVKIYVITYGDARHGTGIFGATLDSAHAERMAEEAERHYHKCYGGPLCDLKLAWPNEGQRSREVHIRIYEGEESDGSDGAQ